MDAPRSRSIAKLTALALIAPLAHGADSLDCSSHCLAKLSALQATYPAHGPIRLITQNVSDTIIYVNVGLEYQSGNAWSEALPSVNAPPGRKRTILALIRSGTEFRMTLDPDQPAPSSDWRARPLRFRVDVFVDGRLSQKVYSTQFRLIP